MQTVFPFADQREEVPHGDQQDVAVGWDRILRTALADPDRHSGFLPQAEEAVRAQPGDGHNRTIRRASAAANRRASIFTRTVPLRNDVDGLSPPTRLFVSLSVPDAPQPSPQPIIRSALIRGSFYTFLVSNTSAPGLRHPGVVACFLQRAATGWIFWSRWGTHILLWFGLSSHNFFGCRDGGTCGGRNQHASDFTGL
jgi:hypothetical protein